MKAIEQGDFLYERLARELETQISEGVYEIGDRLPSIRMLCARKRVSVATAMQSLSILEARGMVEARPKSGYFVRRRRLDRAVEPRPVVSDLQPQVVGVSDIVADVFRQTSGAGQVPLGAGIPSPELLPIERLSKFLAAAVRDEPRHLGVYGEAGGHPEFRKQLARRFSLIGCELAPGEIVATGGAMDSLNLGIRAVTKPGDIVAVETPCYFGILEILESLGLRALPIPSTGEEGIDLDLLAEAIERHAVKAVAMAPTFSNPNGSCLSDAKRIRLLELLADHDLPLVEDDLYGDLPFEGERVRPVKAFDREGRVLYCGSFSKCLTPGLRVGWIAGGRYAERVKRLRFISTVTTPVINQIAISRFLEAGAMDRHLRGLRSALKTQVAQVSEAVLESFPAGTAISRPRGGYFLWVQLPDGIDAMELYRLADAEGIHIAPGQIFCPHASIRNRIRLSCGHPVDDRIRGGIERLGGIVRQLQKERLKRG